MIRRLRNRRIKGTRLVDIDASSRWLIVVGCICAGLGVAAGAFGAHMLKGALDQPMLAVYDTATRYQMYHAFGMIVSGLTVRIARDAGTAKAGWMFLAGILFILREPVRSVVVGSALARGSHAGRRSAVHRRVGDVGLARVALERMLKKTSGMFKKAVQRGRSKVRGAKNNERHVCGRARGSRRAE